MPDFQLVAPFEPTGDQPTAIERLADGLASGIRHQTLLGATGTGKTYTIAQAIARHQRPTLVLAHNKTLAAQLCNELREFFPKNAVEYFISYYDYYQPEAYVPVSDTYIAKTASINEEIDMLRHSATRSLFERNDVIVVASISCIYGLGIPSEYLKAAVKFQVGDTLNLRGSLRDLVTNQYSRNDLEISRGRFRVRGDVLEIGPAYEDRLVRIELFGDEVEAIRYVDPTTGETIASPPGIPKADQISWGGQGQRDDNYYITEDSEPAPMGASLGWRGATLGYTWRKVEANSVLGAFTDSDFGNGGTNLEGYALTGSLATTNTAAAPAASRRSSSSSPASLPGIGSVAYGAPSAVEVNGASPDQSRSPVALVIRSAAVGPKKF